MKTAIKAATIVALSVTAAAEVYAQAATQDVNISATVPGYCRINGAANPAALNATVPVSPTGVVDTTNITFNVTDVVCNTVADLQARSLSGAVKSGAATAPGFQNFFNYTGEAKIGTVTSTINTATTATATGVETGNVAPTAGPINSTLNITVTPQAAASPLVAGSYSDTLRITITPQ